MAAYIVSRIVSSDRRAYRQYCTLLTKAGISLSQPTDYIVGIYDSNYELLAAGSLFQDQLHSVFVDSPYRGRGLLNQIITHLYELRFQSGHFDMYAAVPEDLGAVFKDVGFHEIRKISSGMVYMGNQHAV